MPKYCEECKELLDFFPHAPWCSKGNSMELTGDEWKEITEDPIEDDWSAE